MADHDVLHEFGINACQQHRSVVYCQMYRSFLPEASFALWVLSLTVCVHVRVLTLKLVCILSHHPFKLEPTNSDKRSKTPWLRSLLFWVLLDLDFQGEI